MLYCGYTPLHERECAEIQHIKTNLNIKILITFKGLSVISVMNAYNTDAHRVNILYYTKICGVAVIRHYAARYSARFGGPISFYTGFYIPEGILKKINLNKTKTERKQKHGVLS
jgi:hypothetical protein